MAESPVPKEESTAQRQARLRREKRNARIASEGNDRLAKITQLSGRPAPAPEDAPLAKPNQPTAASVHDDPDEVDISEHHYTPRITPRPSNPGTPSQQMSPFSLPGGGNPFGPMPPGFAGPNSSSDNANADPMMAMMQQMMGGAGGMPNMGDPNDPNNPMNDLPPFMKNLMQAQQASASQTSASATPATNIWRIIHALFALSLAAYIALTGTFNGTKLSRYETLESYSGPNLFYLFATAELVLQTSRYFLEQGRLSGGGWLATIANSGLVPEPYGGWVRVLGRYSVIWQTVVADAVAVVFCLGVVAWWRGANIA